MFDLPPADLIVAEVRKALDQGIDPGFAQKVAANALGIAGRELTYGPGQNAKEADRLAALLGGPVSVEAGNARLCAAIRSGAINSEDLALIAHLILTSIAKLEIDQPTYPPFKAWKAGV